MKEPAKRQTIYEIKELVPETAIAAAGGNSHTGLRTTNGMLLFVAAQPNPPGTRIQVAHNHPYEQLMVVLKGCLVVEIDGQSHELRAGSALIVPALAWHSAYVSGSEACSTFEMFAPVRRDFLELTAHQTEQFGDQGVDWVKEGTNSWTQERPAHLLD
jgi:mannose-6-phosphate isomerase-like protein (cupin superfamily)